MQSLREALGAEETSLRQGIFMFQSKRKRSGADGGATSSSAVPNAKHLKDKKLLSFDEDT